MDPYHVAQQLAQFVCAFRTQRLKYGSLMNFGASDHRHTPVGVMRDPLGMSLGLHPVQKARGRGLLGHGDLFARERVSAAFVEERLETKFVVATLRLSRHRSVHGMSPSCALIFVEGHAQGLAASCAGYPQNATTRAAPAL
jgi:hypothetical protein